MHAAHLVYQGDFDRASEVLRRTCAWLESGCGQMRSRFEALAQTNGEPFVRFAAEHLDYALPADASGDRAGSSD